MPLPGVGLSIQDFSLGAGTPTAEDPHVKIGTSAGGTANTVYSFGDPKAAKDVLLSGPLLEAVAEALAYAGGPVLAVPVTASTAGTNSAVTLTGTGVTPGLGVTGTPKDAYEVQVKIVTGGAVGTATFQISFDGGDTWHAGGSTYATAASVTTFATETGLTLTFAAGTYVAGDVYKFTSTAPAYTSADLNTALDAVLADARPKSFVHVVGTVGGATDTDKVTNLVALATAIDSKMTAWETAKNYAFAIVEAPDVADAALTGSAGLTGFASKRVGIAAGYAEITSQISGRIYKRPQAWPIVDRVAAIQPSEDPGWVGSPRGSLPGIVKLYRDERVTPGLDAIRLNTLRTYESFPGFYVTRGRLMAPTGSDFSDLVNRRVMDRACRVARQALMPYVNAAIRVNRITGYIDERQARAIEGKVDAQLRAALVAPDQASDLSVRIKRDNNILSTSQLLVTIRVIPKGYSRFIEVDIGFENPALKAKAA